MLEIPLVELDDLSVRGGRLMAHIGNTHIRGDAVYRRTDEGRLTTADGEFTDVGAALIEPLSNGTISCVNAFGAGIADDKLIHAYVEDMVRFCLGEGFAYGVQWHAELLVERPEQLALFEALVRAAESRARDAAEAA
jgi:uncharacterized circularly permuted ATP-grasp superfamily protein